jgi:6-phosphogluconolactonase (cycloisomerase 2 family)
MTNSAAKNEVIGYRKLYDGTYVESGRYATGGRGSGGTIDPLQSQGSLSFSNDHNFLFAANAGSGTVSVFRVLDSRLVLVDRAISGGSEPLSIAQTGHFVYVLNGAAAGSVVAFRFFPNGRLEQIEDATKYLSGAGAGGSSITVSPDGQFLSVTERNTNDLDVFRIQPDGMLAPIVVNHISAPGVFAAQFAPNSSLIVSQTGPAGVPNGSTISSYSILPGGTVAPISQSVPTYGTANCWNAITPDGKRVYVSNAGSSTVSGYTIGNDGTLTPIGSTVVGTNPQGSTNLDITISSDGQYLFSLNSGTGTIGIFAIQNDGTLKSEGEIHGFTPSSGFNGIAAL